MTVDIESLERLLAAAGKRLRQSFTHPAGAGCEQCNDIRAYLDAMPALIAELLEARAIVRYFMGEFEVCDLDEEDYDNIEKRARELWHVAEELREARRDAERYRWLRDIYDWEGEIPGFDWETSALLDAAIDAARTASASGGER